jgi:glycosyltransferase involved in cell wall biosynthesis
MGVSSSRKSLRIALLGNHSPRRCGIATFTGDFASALLRGFPDIAVDIYAMNDAGSAYDYPPQVVQGIDEANPIAYADAARAIGASGADLLWVQHEYGIFGGPAGSHLLRLLDRITIPVIVTLHTVLTNPNEDQRRVLEAVVRRASRVVVMAERGRRILTEVHGISRDKIVVIPHGIADRPLLDTADFKERFGLAGRKTVLTFGLLSPNKGIETMIRAMPRIVTAEPDVMYTVLGATHPHLVAREGERYRDQLTALAAELGVAGQVRFVDAFVDVEDLLDQLCAADLYVTPYLNPAQITSGTLSYAVGLGKPVISTPYWHAEELLADGVGALVAFDDPEGFARRIIELLSDDALREDMRARAYARGRTMTWASVADQAIGLARAVTAEAPVRLPMRTPPIDIKPRPSLLAVRRMSDSCGIFQHSIFSVPDRAHGYCLDDNARALILAHRVGEDGPDLDRLVATYCSFIQNAWNADVGRFRNFMSYRREWLEEVGSDDSFGRGLWATGITAAEAARHDIRVWALHLFEQVASRAIELESSRAAAFSILGADAVLEAHPGHSQALTLVETLSRRILARLRAARREGWIWFEDVLAYDNARLPEALLRAGRRLGDRAMIDEGLRSLEWLDAMQTAEEGHFRAIGTESFGRPHSPPLPFDQQPLEAWATIEAAEIAYAVSGDPRWLTTARHAFGWYLGRNDLGLHMATLQDGGCYDGLMPDRANLNQGAESVLAFQLAQCAMLRVSQMQASPGLEVFAAAE